MKGAVVLGGATLGFLAIPLIALLALTGVASTAVACTSEVAGELAPDAQVPVTSRRWVGIAHASCPALPPSYIAAMMAQESGFRPDAYADDKNGGTWGLLQINASIWRNAYGAPWSADVNGNGVWDIKEPEIQSAVGGRCLCARLAGVRAIPAAHPDWASTRDLSELDALVVAYNAGEGRLRSYPVIPSITARYIEDVRAHITAGAGAHGGTVTGASSPESCNRIPDRAPGRSPPVRIRGKPSLLPKEPKSSSLHRRSAADGARHGRCVHLTLGKVDQLFRGFADDLGRCPVWSVGGSPLSRGFVRT